MRLDHLCYAAGPEGLGATVQRLGARLGASFIDGGLHPRFGTRNFILPLANGAYLEVVGRLDHPAADKEPFGQAVSRCTEAGGGWMGWAIAVSDMSRVEKLLGRSAVPGHRFRPDGVSLEWQQIGVRNMLADPLHPYFVKWLGAPENHPGATPAVHDVEPIRISSLELAGDPQALESQIGVLEGINLNWLPAESASTTGIVSVEFETADGLVQLD